MNRAERAYLDHNATSPLRHEVREAVEAALALSGNASSVHAEGRAARKLIEEARSDVAALLAADPKHLVFTSSGSEGAAMLLAPGVQIGSRAPVERLIGSAIEHSCVLTGGRFASADIAVCPVTKAGVVDLDALARLLADDPRPAFVAVMAANNETGIIQPVAAAAELVHAAGGTLLCDAVQALGKLPLSLDAMGADAVIVSGHKIGAPQGVGAVVTAGELRLPVPLIRGGGQESRRRAGTENLIGIAGFGAAARAVREGFTAEIARIRTLRDWIERDLVTIYKDVEIIGAGLPRLANTSLVVQPGLVGETAVIAFDLAGVAVATGSACSSGKVAPSHVLAAMGLTGDLAKAAIRISLGWSTTEKDVASLLEAWQRHARKFAALRQVA